MFIFESDKIYLIFVIKAQNQATTHKQWNRDIDGDQSSNGGGPFLAFSALSYPFHLELFLIICSKDMNGRCRSITVLVLAASMHGSMDMWSSTFAFSKTLSLINQSSMPQPPHHHLPLFVPLSPLFLSSLFSPL